MLQETSKIKVHRKFFLTQERYSFNILDYTNLNQHHKKNHKCQLTVHHIIGKGPNLNTISNLQYLDLNQVTNKKYNF